MQSGTYNFVGDVIAAFRAPGITRQKVEFVREIVSKAASGEMPSEEAARQADGISAGIGAVLREAHKRGISFDRILAIIAILLAFWSSYSTDADVQAALAESQKQTELSRQMLSELKVQTSAIQEPARRPAMRPPLRIQRTDTKNRAERRKAASLARRSKDAPK